MKVGYCEFNHNAHMKLVDGRFFVRVTGDQKVELAALAKSVKCNGFTNYEAPIMAVLSEFEKSDRRESRHTRGQEANRHILFLTDGIPTQGV